ADNQLKLRGFRIELGEIEAVLRENPQVGECVVIAREDLSEEKQLVAYIVASEDNRLSAKRLRDFLLEKLPSYMVPAHFVELHRMPVAPTGKIDYKRLPSPKLESDRWSTHDAHTPVEEILLGIWEETLKRDHVGLHDDFFDLGGHSLLAIRVISRMRSAFGIDLPLKALFEAPTVATLAVRVEREQQEGHKKDMPPLTAVPRGQMLPLSFAQQRLWFIDQLEPTSAAYNSPTAIWLTGSLDRQALDYSVTEIVRRHEVLRTSFPLENGEPVQRIAPSGKVSVPLVDIAEIPEQEQVALDIACNDSRLPFNLSEGPLFRMMLVRLAADKNLFVLTLHHVVSDGWSVDILIREFTALYSAFVQKRPSPLPELAVQYADFAYWQRQWLTGKALDTYVSYWRSRLAGVPPLRLTMGRSFDIQTGVGATASYDLRSEAIEALQDISRTSCVTLFMTLLAVFEILMNYHSGQMDFAIGTPVAGRDCLEVEDLIGFFVNMLPLRADLSGDPTFKQILERVRAVTLEAYAHQALPFEKLVEELKPARVDGAPEIFQVTFAVQNERVAVGELPGLKIEMADSTLEEVRFGLVLWIVPSSSGWQAWWRYSTGRFDATQVDRLQRDFASLLEEVIVKPDARLSEFNLVLQRRLQKIEDVEHARAHASRVKFKGRKRMPVQPA
ncbi:MAG TPA: condensation domain-containing protein, partial [Candidatus Angelobacter sp.]